MPAYIEGMTTLEQLLEDGTHKSDMQKGPIEHILTPEDRANLEHATGKLIMSGIPKDNIDDDDVVCTPGLLPTPLSGERRRRGREYVKSLRSDPEKTAGGLVSRPGLSQSRCVPTNA